MKTLTGSLASSTTAAAPRIDCFPARPSPKNRGMALVIFPGGGYEGLAEYEGAGYAEYFAERGIAGFVVTYRLGSKGFRHPAMLEDALAAIATVRGRAAELGVDPRRIGVMGSSAGGHLAAHAMTAWGDYASPVPLRPDFGVLCYPVITMADPLGHAGSRAALLGASPAPALIEQVSCEKRVTRDTPPCFLWHTRDDEAVPFRNTTMFADALDAAGVGFEMHVFDHGPHGLGHDLTHPWAGLCHRWLESLA
jgi:acetyl esterase/lipase